MTETCKEDAELPDDLIAMYFQGGKQLRCPQGTTSESGSHCLGQCEKPPAQIEPISILDPVDESSLTEEMLEMALPREKDDDEEGGEDDGDDGRRLSASKRKKKKRKRVL